MMMGGEDASRKSWPESERARAGQEPLLRLRGGDGGGRTFLRRRLVRVDVVVAAETGGVELKGVSWS